MISSVSREHRGQGGSRSGRSGRARTLRWVAVPAGTAVLVATGIGLTLSAHASTLFTADFQDGLTGWSRSGGTWTVVSDGSKVLRQGKRTAGNAREFAGSTRWTDYTVQARVKPLALPTAGSGVALLGHVTGSTSYDRLVLLGSGRVELQAVHGGSVRVLASASGPAAGGWTTLRLQESDGTVSGWVGGRLVGHGSSADRHGRIGLQTLSATAEFDDVTVSEDGTAPPSPTPVPTTAAPTATPTESASPTVTPTTSPTPVPSTPNVSPTPAPAGTADGYASVNGGTTGGAGGSTVTVTTLSGLQTEAARSGAEVVKVSGSFTCSGDITVGSNKSIIGVGANSGMTGCGLKLKGVTNVIIRNLKISKVTAAGGTGDAVHIEKSTHVWVDHNDLSSDQTHGKDYYDGLVDITHASDDITVSWNRLHDHFKAVLIGHSDSNGSEDTGKLHVTLHHNWFENVNSRMPSLRFGTAHVYDNYFLNGSTGSHARMGAQLLAQNNVYSAVSTPILTTGDSTQDGYVNQSGNEFGSGTNRITQTGSLTSPPYRYSLNSTTSVVRLVTAGAGTGRI